MRLLIDGYNLLFAADIAAAGHNLPRLARSRLGLLKRLVAILPPDHRRETVVVFDARNAPVGTPRQTEYGELVVRFAAGYADADALLEELIEDHPAPHALTVVSGDRRIQRAARRRKARAVDSETWYAEQSAAGEGRADPLRAAPPKPGRMRGKNAAMPDATDKPPLLSDDVFAWLEALDASDTPTLPPSADDARQPSPSTPNAPPKPRPTDSKDGVAPFDSPFPPGYGEDIRLD